MNNKTPIVWAAIAGLVIISLFLVTPLSEKIRLGLDLQGGYSFTVQLDKDALAETIRERYPDAPQQEIDQRVLDAEKSADETAVGIIRSRIDSLGTEEPVITKGKDGRIYVQIPGASEEQRDRAERLVRSVAALDFRLVSPDSARWSQEVLSSRNAPKGYKIAEMGDVGLCYVRDESVEQPDFRELRRFGNPKGEYICMLERNEVNGTTVYTPILVRSRPNMSGVHLNKAGVTTDEFGRVMVSIAFDAEGTRDFASLTRKHAAKNGRPGRQLAIVLDGLVYSAPVLDEPITGGKAVIRGNFTYAEANMLKNVLNSGAMPAPLKFLGKRFVNPTLGEDSIADASNAILIGCAAVILFILWYYRAMGFVADIALVLNFILLPLCAVLASGILSQFTADATLTNSGILRLPVLTLPGIAGLLLSVGMAVDANVLIYERSREELNNNRPTFPSLMSGYQRAFSAIFDGNLTTIITGIVLFIFGTGPVRGFSVTLVAGIIASMFTALVVTKTIFRTFVKEDTAWKPQMVRLIPPGVKIDFISCRKKYLAVAAAVIVVTVATTVIRGLNNPASIFAVDFTGGANVSYIVTPKAPADDAEAPAFNPEQPPVDLALIRSAANAAGIDDASPQYQRGEKNWFLEVKTVHTDIDGQEISSVLTDALQKSEDLSGVSFNYLDVDSIGSQIGKEMKRTAAIAIVLSTIAMLIYIGSRFEFGFGLGAIAALVHDVLMTIGIFSCLGFQFNLTIVAALLTIVGYGVNDTIVLFDRVREKLHTDSKSDFPELVNSAINETLSRTLLTSITTMLPVIALIVFCKGDIRAFAVCMLIGIVVSTLSTIYISSSTTLAYYHNKRPVAKEN